MEHDGACRSATAPVGGPQGAPSPSGALAVDAEAVRWAYRLLLGREPESEEVVRGHVAHHRTLGSLRESIMRSSEFRRGFGAAPAHQPRAHLPLGLPPLDIEYQASEELLDRCIAKIKSAWAHLGETRPHHSVLTEEGFRPEHIEASLDRFWASGEGEARSVRQMLERHGIRQPSGRECIEYGCGVGRVTGALARMFRRVRAYDLSPTHLELARRRIEELGLGNVELVLCAESVRTPLPPCDVFYSRIVFQHNPPPVIARLVQLALRALRAGGIAIFQVPTYMVGYRFRIAEWLATDHVLDMQMHCLPQRAIYDLIEAQGCTLLEVREDDATGASERFLSNTFVVGRGEPPGARGSRWGGRWRRWALGGARGEDSSAATKRGADLPDLTRLYPQKYLEVTAGSSTFWAATDEDFRLMYDLIHRHGYYERAGVWTAVIDLDKEVTAAIVRGLGARSCIELGCFTGPVLSVLERAGVEVRGIEVSREAIARAHANVAARIRLGDLLALDTDERFDVLLAMDILEHLNPLDLDRYVERIAGLLEPSGFALVNSPMFGPDDVFGTVFEPYLQPWREAGPERFWRHLHCDGTGWPVHGHLVWAAPQWWERLFRAHGLVRERRLETLLQALLGPFFERVAPARRSLFLLRRAQHPPEIEPLARELGALLTPLTAAL